MARDIEQRVKQIVAKQFGVKPNTINRDLVFVEDLRADPLDLVELMKTCEEEFLISIPIDDSERLTTVGLLVEYLTAKIPE